MKVKENFGVIIFGASGDLTLRKLMPALYELHNEDHLPDNFFILGVSRKPFSDDTYRQAIKDKIGTNNNSNKNLAITFLNHLHYISIDTTNTVDYRELKELICKLNQQYRTNNNFIFYLATPPHLYLTIANNISQHSLNNQNNGWKRLIIEKPFGYDLNSAIKLNTEILNNYSENQLYRIDHYLGKETVQNILVTRFSNVIFEPLWNRNYIHHIEITSSENLGIVNRGGYYDQSGAIRDMVQNHLLQLVGLVAMEPPALFNSNSIRNEIVKVFQSLRPLEEENISKNVILGQYTESIVKGKIIKGYRQEKAVNPDSKTETYVALKLFIDNWRWTGVPFYLRTGKCLPTTVAEIVIHFKHTPHHLFCSTEFSNQPSTQLILRIQPDEGILLKFGMKVPGAGFKVQQVNMDFHYNDLSHKKIPSAYERLLLDCMQGDSTLYARNDAVEESWKYIMPILKAKESNKLIIHGYPAGSWGPKNADDLIDGDNLTWRYPCKNLSNDGTFCEL